MTNIKKYFFIWIVVQAAVFEAAKKLHMLPRPVIFWALAGRKTMAISVPGFVVVNKNNLGWTSDPVKVRKAAYHEMRHHWQFMHYPVYCLWWITHRSVYLRYYHQKLNWMEEDARQFAASGVDDNSIPRTPLAVLKELYRLGRL